MTNEELCILAQEGNANAEEELIRNLLPSLQALAAKFEAQYSGLGWQMVYTDSEYASISYETSKTTKDYMVN